MTDRRKRQLTIALGWIFGAIMAAIALTNFIGKTVVGPNLDSVYMSKAEATKTHTQLENRLNKTAEKVNQHSERLIKAETIMDRVEQTLTRVENILNQRRRRR